MKWFENWKIEREVKRFVIDEFNAEICAGNSEAGSESEVPTKALTAEEQYELLKKKRDVKMNGIEVNEVLKVIANVAIVAVLVGFEMSQILSQKGSRFVKVL